MVKKGNCISRSTLSKYIDLLIKAKIIYDCNRFDTKSKKILAGEKKYYLADTSFYYARNTDNKVNYGPALENMVYIYAKSKNYSVSVGKIGSFECDFIVRSPSLGFAYIQVCYSILSSKETEDREYRALEKIKDNWPKYVATTDFFLQQRNGIIVVSQNIGLRILSRPASWTFRFVRYRLLFSWSTRISFHLCTSSNI